MKEIDKEAAKIGVEIVGAQLDDDIIVTKSVGLEGTYILINDYNERIQKRR